MGGQLRVRPVDLRVIQVRLVDPGPQVVRHQPRRHPAEERERLHMRLRPRGLIHRQHRPHEHVPRTGQDHRERPYRAPQPGSRVGPHPQLAVVDLGLRTSIDLIPQHHDLVTAHFLGQVRRHIPLQRRHRRGQAVFVTQPLMDRRLRHPRLQRSDDVLVMHGDPRPRRLPQRRIGQLREPARHQRRPPRRRPRRPTRPDPRRHRRGQVLTDGFAIHAQAVGHLAQRPPRIPVDQDFGHINHGETSPRHRFPSPLQTRQNSS